jgi:hypothetical protein
MAIAMMTRGRNEVCDFRAVVAVGSMPVGPEKGSILILLHIS